MGGIESFGRTPAGEPTHFEIENARQIPIIENGLSSIKLGIFTRLIRKLQNTNDQHRAISLAYCVTLKVFCEPIKQPSFDAFARNNGGIIDSEFRSTFADGEFTEPISLAYAAKMIALGWETRNPFNPIANQLTEIATANNMEIPNIVQAWGAEAIVKFFQYSQKFLLSTLTPQL